MLVPLAHSYLGCLLRKCGGRILASEDGYDSISTVERDDLVVSDTSVDQIHRYPCYRCFLL